MSEEEDAAQPESSEDEYDYDELKKMFQ